MEGVIVNLFEWIFHIVKPEDFNPSLIIMHALRLKPEIKSLNRSDGNAMMKNLFGSKSLAPSGIYALRDICEKFERLHFERIMSEKCLNKYNSETVDDIIREMVIIFKQDLEEARRTILQLKNDNTVSATSLWSVINDTASKAVQKNVKWSHYLTMNSFVAEVIYRSNTKIENWLIENQMGFDEEQFKKELERNKERNINNHFIRKSFEQQNKLFNRWENSAKPKPYNPRNKGKGKGGNKSKPKQLITVKQAKQDVKHILDVKFPNISLSNDICVYYNHPTAKCMKSTCLKRHVCPGCNEEHTISDCPQ